MKTKVVLFGLVLIGFFLRTVDISNNPPSLYGDELTITLDAYTILNTGYDQLGNFLPLTFEMGAGRPAGYVYFSIPFIGLFGPNALGVRMLSILSGIGIIIMLFLLGKRIFSEKIGLISAALITFSFWDINISRGAFEAHFALFLALLGTYFFLLINDKGYFLILSIICFGLTIHTYPTYKLILIFFIPLLYWFQFGISNPFKITEKRYLSATLLVGSLLIILSVIQTFTAGSEQRFSEINIFNQKELREEVVQKINFERTVSSLPADISGYFFNKPLEYLKIYGDNYLQNFSPDFLFLHGDRNPRHNMTSLGQFYLIEIVLILFGLISIKQRKILVFLLLWILIAPLASAFLASPSALRSAFLFPPLILLSSVGVNNFLGPGKFKKIVLIFIIFLLSIQFIYFLQKSFFLSPNEYSRFWSYPAKLATSVATQNLRNYDYIILSDKIDNIEYAYPVYANIAANDVISQNKQKSELNGFMFKKFGNVYIGDIPESQVESFISTLPGPTLYIGDPTMTQYLENYETLPNKDGFTGVVLRKKP